MDQIVSAALEEICSQGANGISLKELWPKLQSSIYLCNNVKQALWTNLLNVPNLQFKARNVSYTPSDDSVRSFEDSERLNLKIVAAEHLRNPFLGLYEDASIPSPQRRALERVAIARTKGITQSELAKEFGIKGNEIFYVLRSLEGRGLVVRNSTIVRTKESCNEGELKSSSIVNTNLIYLHRYGKHLGSQQRLEITKEDMACQNHSDAVESAVSGERIKEDVLINDYLPSLKAICDKLEEANDKVLVVSDIKRDLGYRRAPGHRSWRNICGRLKDAGLVEEFQAEVSKKVVTCLRLLKNFDPKNFEAKSRGFGENNDGDTEQVLKFGKKGHITDQVVELPIERQIFDIVEAEGSRGLTVFEVCKRLGINNKKNYTRLRSMFSRFGMQLQAENVKRGIAYRVYSPGNFNPDSSQPFSSTVEDLRNENEPSNPHVEDVPYQEKFAQTNLERNASACSGDIAATFEEEKKEDEQGSNQDSLDGGENNCMVICPSNMEDELGSNAKMDIVPDEANIVPFKVSPAASMNPPQSDERYYYLNMTPDSTQREQRILQRLQDEKLILAAELYRWLLNLEKGKQTIMARKSLVRILNKLQQEGHCKCIHVSVPVITNYGRSRPTEVILHPSVKSLSPEQFTQIHDMQRSFDMESRGQGLSRLKNNDQSIPVLSNVQRNQIKPEFSDVKAVKSEAMRSNGFVLAKMVRTKLLHKFLWKYVSTAPDWYDALSIAENVYDTNNSKSTCKLFSLDAAIKAFPLELFLQVVGSAQKFEDMIEKCQSGLRLFDVPLKEYKLLMDTQATGRLSWIVDILRRLKLIRLVSDEHQEDEAEVRYPALTYALEFKPYIEEPLSIISPSLSLNSPDLCPRVRHDFFLSSEEAVDVYWKTLEYCYAAADPQAALHSFPGSAVQEVTQYRSWASVRVMTAGQRAQLLQRVMKDDPDKKLSFNDCEKIAKDLNLTLEQVLRVYYDKRQQRLTRFEGVLNFEGQPCASSSRKRKRVSKAKSLISDSSKLSDNENISVNGINLQAACEEDYQMGTLEEPEPEEDEEDYSFINQCSFWQKPSRRQRFSWTEQADRQLVIQYVRHRVVQGAKFHRTDWASLPDLPAPPSTCRRRIASLNHNLQFRKAIMRLCNMLSERYTKHLNKTQNRLEGQACASFSSGESLLRDLSDSVQNTQQSGFEQTQWYDFDDRIIQIALDEVLRYKRMASKAVGPLSEEWSDLNVDATGDDPLQNKLNSTTTLSGDSQNRGQIQRKDSRRRLRCHRLPRKFIKLLNEGISISRQVSESLAVSNAVELFKLVFLSTSTAPEVPNLLAGTLRRYTQHDLFAAFNYLREKKFMVSGNGSHPFVLSQQFLHSISSSPFPSNTGKRATKFGSWLREREKDLIEGVVLATDLQSGEIFHLFALVSCGELSISPCLPDEGVGEVEDSRGLKRKIDDSDFSDGDGKTKKMKSLFANECDIISRREKGFPGIMVTLSHTTISVNTSPNLQSCNSSFHSSDMMEVLNFGGINPVLGPSSESTWESMTNYAEHVMSIPSDIKEQVTPLHPELFRAVYIAIQEAADQGLSMEEISRVINMKGERKPEVIVEVLQTFGRALKVNAFDKVHVVDSLYRSKYFLSSMAARCQDLKPVHTAEKYSGTLNDSSMNLQLVNRETEGANSQEEISTNHDVHKVTYVNHEAGNSNALDGCVKDKAVLSEGGPLIANSHSYRPILPWINGDGTINDIVYKGLTRRIFGTVMQSPGILEDGIIRRMDVLNPQSCRKLLELMILDNHLIVRKMHQTACSAPPAILGSLFGSNSGKPKIISRDHFFANPTSTFLL